MEEEAEAALDLGERVIVLLEGKKTILSLPVEAIPALTERRSRKLLKAYLFAVALAHGLGLSGAAIMAALQRSRLTSPHD